MKLTPATAIAREVAGYRPPISPSVCCANCGAIRPRNHLAPYYCRRHMFYVHSRGVCPKFSTEPYAEPAPRKPPFVQEEMFK